MKVVLKIKKKNIFGLIFENQVKFIKIKNMIFFKAIGDLGITYKNEYFFLNMIHFSYVK